MTECLLTDDHELRADSHRPDASPRLYDVPWLVLLLAEHDPDRALAALRGFYARGGERFLAIGAGLAARELAAVLRAAGARATPPRSTACCAATRSPRSRPATTCPPTRSTTSSRWSRRCWRSSAPRATRRGRPGPRLDEAIAHRLPWLLAFGGPQPHVRLRDIAIRHWDGYWFGRESSGATRSRTTGAP